MNTSEIFEKKLFELIELTGLLPAFKSMRDKFCDDPKKPENKELYQRFLNADEIVARNMNTDGGMICGFQNRHCACMKQHYQLTFSISKKFFEVKPME